MLKSALPRVSARSRVMGACSCRMFATTYPTSSALTSKPLYDNDGVKTKGSGKSNLLVHTLPSHIPLAESVKSPQPQLTKVIGVSTVPPMVHGDWVLFHPVYTQEELKAVEVSK